MYVDDLLIIQFAKEDAKKEGRAEGRAEGITEGKTEIVMSMLDEGLDVGTIAKYTKLTVDEVEKINENYQAGA